MMRREFMQKGATSVSTGVCARACATSIALENGQGGRSRGINKHLRKFGKLDHQQGMDLIFVAHDVGASVGAEPASVRDTPRLVRSARSQSVPLRARNARAMVRASS